MEFKEGVYTEVVKIEKGEPVRLVISPEIKAAMLTVNNISRELTINNNTAPTGAGITAKNSLTNKGWTVLTD